MSSKTLVMATRNYTPTEDQAHSQATQHNAAHAAGQAGGEVNNVELPNFYNGILDAAVQEQEIQEIVAFLPHANVHDIREKLLSLAADQRFVMNYWLKVCKLRASRGLPMPWDQVH